MFTNIYNYFNIAKYKVISTVFQKFEIFFIIAYNSFLFLPVFIINATTPQL